MKKLLLSLFLVLFSISVNAACTDLVKIKKLYPRDAGYVAIEVEGMSDIDIMNCGINNYRGLLLNLHDSSGTIEGKKMMLSVLLTAFTAGKSMKLCSGGCDSQYKYYSRLDTIDELQ